MIIREMTLDDLPSVAAVGALSTQSPWDERSTLTYFLRDDTLFVVAEEPARNGLSGSSGTDGPPDTGRGDEDRAAIVGFAALLLTPPESDVLDIIVRTEYRGKGIGTKLLDGLCDHALLRQVDTVFLEVRPSNTPARKLYEKLGFEQIGIRRNYYTDPAEDAISMVRRRNISFL